MAESGSVTLRFAQEGDVATILGFIKDLAEYEKLSHQVEADEATLAASLFGDRPEAEVVIAELDGEPAGFALFFHNYSTFLARKGLYLEDLFVRPSLRGRWICGALRLVFAHEMLQGHIRAIPGPRNQIPIRVSVTNPAKTRMNQD